MKTRNSLVSNSSSASFIILWRSLSSNVDSKESAIKTLLRYNDAIDNKESLQKLIDSTTELKHDIYETKFHTSMMNSFSDFGPDAAYFFLELSHNSYFEIIKSSTDECEGW